MDLISSSWGIPRLIVRGAANIGELERSKLVAVNEVKINLFIQNVNYMSLKGAENYVPHPLYVTFILCFLVYRLKIVKEH